MRKARLWGSASLVAILLMSTVAGVPAVAQDEPIFHLPFECGDTWTASTRFAVDIPAQDGIPAEKHPAHSPSPHAVDFNRGTKDLGLPVYAGADGGTVVSVYADAEDNPQNDANAGYGNSVVVSYPGGVTLRFAHLDTVTIGEDVEAGSVLADTQVGTVGSTGLGLGADGSPSTAYHLHYEQVVDGAARPVVIEGETWSIGEWDDPTAEITDDHDDLANHPGKPHPSQNCGSETPSDPSTPAVEGSTKVVWSKKTTRDASHVSFGKPVKLVTRFHGDVDVEEVRFTAHYPAWSNAKDAAKVSDFDPKRTWRTLKVCRPKTKGCSWDGDSRAATVTYRWDPTGREKKRSIQGVPRADAAISTASEACVPVTLGVDVVDGAGTTTSAPGGKTAQRCDAKAEGLARTVYLDPLAPPPAPRSLRIRETDYLQSSGPWYATAWRLTWDDVEGESGYRVYVDYILAKPDHNCPPTIKETFTKRRLLPGGKVPANVTSLEGVFTPEVRGDWVLGGSRYYVVAVNKAGESQLSRPIRNWYANDVGWHDCALVPGA